MAHDAHSEAKGILSCMFRGEIDPERANVLLERLPLSEAEIERIENIMIEEAA